MQVQVKKRETERQIEARMRSFAYINQQVGMIVSCCLWQGVR